MGFKKDMTNLTKMELIFILFLFRKIQLSKSGFPTTSNSKMFDDKSLYSKKHTPTLKNNCKQNKNKHHLEKRCLQMSNVIEKK